MNPSVIRRSALLVTVLATTLALAACGEDDPNSGQSGNGSISGRVHFRNVANWPASGEVQVGVYSELDGEYLPTGAPDAYTNPIPAGTTNFNYSLTGLAEGTYAAVYVSWRDPGNPAGATVLGVYWAFVDSVGVAPSGGSVVPIDPNGPLTVTLTSGSPDQIGVDIEADIDLVP